MSFGCTVTEPPGSRMAMVRPWEEDGVPADIAVVGLGQVVVGMSVSELLLAYPATSLLAVKYVCAPGSCNLLFSCVPCV